MASLKRALANRPGWLGSRRRHHGSGHRSLGARDFSSVVFSTHGACPLCLDVLIGALSTRTKITSTRGRFIAYRFFDFITYDEGVTE
jgi:hypothetical protein